MTIPSSASVADARLGSIALGFSRAHGRLTAAYSKRYGQTELAKNQRKEDVFEATFEALNWLDALRLHPEGARRIDPDLNDAIRFVRGRVHHSFADAIEFRDDVLMQVGSATGVGVRPPIVIADWCWLRVGALRGGGRSSNAASRERSGETAYESLLAGGQARAALDGIAQTAAEIYNAVVTGLL